MAIEMLEDILFLFLGMTINLWMTVDMNAIIVGFHLVAHFCPRVRNHTSLTEKEGSANKHGQ